MSQHEQTFAVQCFTVNKLCSVDTVSNLVKVTHAHKREHKWKIYTQWPLYWEHLYNLV